MKEDKVGPHPRQSLYSRALLFTVIGCGCLLGAIVVQSWIMVNGTVDRLLQERITLAKSTGSYVEQLIHHQLDQLSSAVGATLNVYAVDLRQVRKAISSTYTGTVFQEGAFVLWPDGRHIASVPEEEILEGVSQEQFSQLLEQARLSDFPVASSLTRVGNSQRPVLIFLKQIRSGSGRLLGFMGGLLHPASNNLLAPFTPGSSGTRSMLQLVDSSGTVVSATSPALLFQPTDHDSMLKQAIQEKKEIKGRCHACHENSPGNRISRESEVLAFAPLRTLPFGMAIRQPEHEALGPAFALQSRLIWLGIAFVALFLGFTTLSVHSVVSPITRLTRAVRKIENTNSELRLPSFGNDELGELARALERWRNRVIESLSALKSREKALSDQFQATTRHLKALQEVGNLGSQKKDLNEFLNGALETMLEFFGFSHGAIFLSHGESKFVAKKCQTNTQECLTGQLTALLPSIAIEPGRLGNFQFYRVSKEELSKLQCCEDTQSAVVAQLKVGELGVSCALSSQSSNLSAEAAPDNEGGAERFPQGRMESLLHQILVSSAHRLLHEKDAQKHKQSREFLQGVLRAQEEERRRIARELHDTLAQDLAAHRFEIERLLKKQEKDSADDLDLKLGDLESRAHEMLITLRRLLLDLRPSVLDTMGFLPALQWYLERVERDHGIRGHVSAEADGFTLSPESEMSLFRIFQEALNNVVQHSGAQHVLVTLNRLENMVEMVIEDDGRGFDAASLMKQDPEPAGQDDRGLGLLGIAERSELLGGKMDIHSTPGEGTSITVRVPAGTPT